MITKKVHVLLLFTTFLAVPSILISAADFPIAQPNCVDQCGNISIPFPFGTTPDCYLHRSFLVTCNDSFNPPVLFMQNTGIEIIDISLTGQVRVLQFIARICFAQNGTEVRSNDPFIRLPVFFTVNDTVNRFTVMGCDSFGFITGEGYNRNYTTGCAATCGGLSELSDGSCGGLGCCQITSVPKNIRRVELSLSSFNNHTDVWGFNNCSYGFVVEEGAFRFSPQSFSDFQGVTKLPMVADWAIGNETCESAKMNVTSYACKSSNSKCYLPNNGYGYRCQCRTGYEGNPYLAGGCQDIDECVIRELSNCAYTCVNSPGTFMCQCPKGYDGDGSGEQGCFCPEGYHGDEIREGGCSRGESSIYKPIAGTLLGIILLILVLCLVYFEVKRRRLKNMKHEYFLRNGGVLLQEKLIRSQNMMSIGTDREMPSNNDVAKIFSSSELQHATNNFHDSMIIGQGGFGTVYKGFLQDNRLVAIKKSKEVDPGQIDQFINEVVVLSRVSHRNIVKLLGCCLETQAPLLVYEFISNGTLHDHIHNESRKRFLDWKMRLRIATETADVLQYLHSAATIPIIHRDVKSANILLDQNFDAKVSDFGASRLVPIDQTQLSTMVQGTFGYLDPEYMQTNQLTEKSDVYSFGVVLVELITGMKPLSYDRPEEQRNLTSYFLSKMQQGCLLDVLDETILGDKTNLEQITEVAKLARVCLNVKGHDRPGMKEVAMELEGLRSGGKHSWVKFEQSAEEIQPLCADALDTFASDNGYSTSIGYISFRDQAKLNGGR